MFPKGDALCANCGKTWGQHWGWACNVDDAGKIITNIFAHKLWAPADPNEPTYPDAAKPAESPTKNHVYQEIRKDIQKCYYCLEGPAAAIHKVTPAPTPEPAKPVAPPPLPTTFLPAGTRFIRQGLKQIQILMEMRPDVVEYRWGAYDDDYRSGYVNRNLSEYKVAVPWQYFWVTFLEQSMPSYDKSKPKEIRYIRKSPRLFWSLNRVVDLETPVFPAMLPNTPQHSGDVYSEAGKGLGYVCLGSDNSYTIGSNTNLVEHAEELVNAFYQGVFNQFLGPKCHIPFNNAKEWEKETKKNPLNWMDWDLSKEEVKPLGDFIGRE